jgi:hypothetical protein
MDAAPLAAADEPERLRRLVEARFGSRVRDFRVATRAGGLVLRGRVASYHAKQLVQEEVIGATASRVVANEIVVDGSGGRAAVRPPPQC